MSPHSISDLNDRHRKSILGSPLVITSGVRDLGEEAVSEIVKKVRDYDAFTDDNDPYGERDFGSFEHGGNVIYWKFDYFDKDQTGGSEDPSDPSKTSRMLTIALMSEY